jgi:AraC family transcriptional regulator, regulatory protein of adaptative response / methylated-DNA-[protein]-cysteine methyltransferase
MVGMNSSTQFANSNTGPGMAIAIDQETAWRQVMNRDADGSFFYAVDTTGVFCRPDCKSRQPLRENVRFFATAEAARAAGFRACKRCKTRHCSQQPFGQGSSAH